MNLLAPSTPPDEASAATRRRARSDVPEEVDVAIIGAGLGGLTAAAYLAQRGVRVAVFEAHYVAGGCATHFARGGRSARYRFDVGLHYIGDCGPGGMIPRILRGVGVELDFTPLDADGFDTLVFPDFTLRVPADVDLYRERLVGLFPRERRAIDRYVRLLRAVMRATWTMDRHEGKPSLRGALSLARDALWLAPNVNRTIAEVFDACGVRDPRLRAALLGQHGDYGVPPSEASAMLHLGLAGHYFRSGAYYPKGGGQTIADRLAEVIERSGGTVHLRRGVERVIVEGGAATGVRLEPRAGEPARTVRARAVLSNADLRATLLRLVGPEHLPASWVERAHGFQMAAALFLGCFGVKGDLRSLGMRRCNYWQFDDYDVEGAYRAMRSGDLGVRGCYVTSATLKDPDNPRFHAPEGVSNVEVMALVPSAGEAWGARGEDAGAWAYAGLERYREAKARLEEEMIRRLERLFPGARDAIVFRESATPLTHARFTRVDEGTGYGLAATPAQFMTRRPGYRGPLPGLFFTGASTRTGHGIVGAMMGGARSAHTVGSALGVEVARA